MNLQCVDFIAFIEYMLAGKTFIKNYTNLFSLNDH